MTLKEAREIVEELREMDILKNSVSVAAIFLDDRVIELEIQLDKCQENKGRAHMAAAKHLSEISAYKTRLEELEECLHILEDTASIFEAMPPEDMKAHIPFSQYTTAEDCRELKRVLTKARQILEE